MANHGKRLTNDNSDPEITGQIVINLYEDSFEVKCTETVDMFTIWAVATGIQEYLENIAEDLDKVGKIMLQ